VIKLVKGLALLAALAGCTSVTKLSEAQIRKRDALDESRAAAQLAVFLHPQVRPGGVCRPVDPVTNPGLAKAEVSSGVVKFTANDKVPVGGSVSGGGAAGMTIRTTYKLVPTRYFADLRTLDNAQIVESPGASLCTHGNRSFVIVHPRDGLWFYIVVDPDDVDDVIADLSFFTPNLVIKKGAGF
jgi:hypothetical protein